MSASAQWSDAAVLGMLWRADALRQTATQIACNYGVSRSAVLGVLYRTRAAAAEVTSGKFPDFVLRTLVAKADEGEPVAALAKECGLSRNAVLIALHSWRLERHQKGAA